MQIKTKILAIIVIGATLLVGAVGVNPMISQAANRPSKVDVLISFTSTPGPNEQALVKGHGGSIKQSFHLVPTIAASIPESAIAGLLNNPHITNIELDGMVYAIDAELDNTWGVKQIGSGTIHDNDNKGAGVKVAVIDSGIDYTHPDLDANFAGGYDFVNSDTDPMDDNGHGTHVAGTIAAEDNDSGVVGVAPEASLYGLKVLDSNGSGSWSDIIAALQWAVDNGIQITNNSYGSRSDPGLAVKAAFDNSAAAGIIHIAAAGNSGSRSGKGNNVGYPAQYDSVIAVAAVDQDDKRANFSSTGPDVELTAPGVNINSTKLGGGYVEFNGTSMASPHVAGSVALVIAAGVVDSNSNGRINDELRQIMNDTAKDLGDTGRDSKYGFGLVDVVSAVAVAVDPSEPAPTEKTKAIVDSISYSTKGGKNNNKHLLVTVAIIDELGSPVANASVSTILSRDSGTSWEITGTTEIDGTLILTLRNTSSGCYKTTITDVNAEGLTWDGTTPANEFCK